MSVLETSPLQTPKSNTIGEQQGALHALGADMRHLGIGINSFGTRLLQGCSNGSGSVFMTASTTTSRALRRAHNAATTIDPRVSYVVTIRGPPTWRSGFASLRSDYSWTVADYCRSEAKRDCIIVWINNARYSADAKMSKFMIADGILQFRV